MSAVSQSALPAGHLVFRSILPERRTIRIPDPHRNRRRTHWSAARTFVGHLAATAFMFVSLVTFAWIISFLFALMRATNFLSADALRIFGLLESILIRLDAAACGVVLIFGIGSYISKVVKGES